MLSPLRTESVVCCARYINFLRMLVCILKLTWKSITMFQIRNFSSEFPVLEHLFMHSSAQSWKQWTVRLHIQSNSYSKIFFSGLCIGLSQKWSSAPHPQKQHAITPASSPRVYFHCYLPLHLPFLDCKSHKSRDVSMCFPDKTDRSNSTSGAQEHEQN